MTFSRQTKVALRLIAGGCAALLYATGAHADTLSVSTRSGWNIFTGSGYRYGPSIIINSDNSISLWTASTGSSGVWDYIRYKKSTDGGVTWGAENIALAPTAGSYDALSACDPGVVYFGGYYYIGYTTTANSDGTDNEVCVARSTSPNSGFEKWNGTGWGGNPQPFIKYTGTAGQWGAGEPSFVVKGSTLYVYYSWVDGSRATRVATVSANDANWPAHLVQRGTAAKNSSDDSMDVKYIDAYGKFIGVAVGDRFSSGSYLHIWESSDGITFTASGTVTANTQDWAHNAGISGTPDGHLDVSDSNFIAYAYSAADTIGWGQWATYLNPVTVAAVPEPGVTSLLASGMLSLAVYAWRRRK